MRHNPNIVALGSTNSNVKEVTAEEGDPTTFKAGLAVRLSTAGKLQLSDDGTAVLIGVSLGEDLADSKRLTAVCRTGNYVPLVLKNDPAVVKIGDITFTSKLFGDLGNAITVTLLDSLTGNTAVVTVEGPEILVAIDAGTTTTTTVKNAIEANAAANALVGVVIDSGDEAAVVAAAAETSLTGGSDFAVPGQPVLIDDTSGQGSVDGDITAALYLTGTLTGVYPDGSTAACAMIALPGGF